MFAALGRGDGLNRERVFAYTAILLVLEWVAFLFLVAGTHGWVVPLEKPSTTDFASFYAAGIQADSGAPAAIYDPPTHFIVEQNVTEPGIEYVHFFYPPIFVLLCALVARLPYLPAFLAFEGVTLAGGLIVAKTILREKSWRILIPVLAYPAILINIGVGQNGLLTAALFGGATLLIDARPALAGVLFGAICYKPQFGVLIPFALIAGGRWRAVAAAAATVAGLVLASIALFGWNTWAAFLDALAGSHTAYESGTVDVAAMANIFGALRLIGAGPAAAYAVQAIVTVSMAGLVAFVWRRDTSLPARAATLAAATVAAAPLALFYDLTVVGIAMCWLVRDARKSGFLAWEKTLLLLIFLAPMFTRSFGTAWNLPVAACATLVLIGLCVRRALYKSV